MIRLLKAALESMAATLEWYVAEVRSGITTVEAVAVDKFNTELRALTTTETERDDLREAAIMVGKLGLTSKDIEPMARNYYTAANRIKHLSAELSRYADELTPGGNA